MQRSLQQFLNYCPGPEEAASEPALPEKAASEQALKVLLETLSSDHDELNKSEIDEIKEIESLIADDELNPDYDIDRLRARIEEIKKKIAQNFHRALCRSLLEQVQSQHIDLEAALTAFRGGCGPLNQFVQTLPNSPMYRKMMITEFLAAIYRINSIGGGEKLEVTAPNPLEVLKYEVFRGHIDDILSALETNHISVIIKACMDLGRFINTHFPGSTLSDVLQIYKAEANKVKTIPLPPLPYMISLLSKAKANWTEVEKNGNNAQEKANFAAFTTGLEAFRDLVTEQGQNQFEDEISNTFAIDYTKHRIQKLMALNEEGQDALVKKEKRKPAKIFAEEKAHQATAAIGALESLQLASLFTMFLKPILLNFFLEFGKYFMLPVVAAANLITAGLAWREAYLSGGKTRLVGRAMVETIAAIGITTAIVGSLAAAAAFAVATPIIFVAVIGGKTLYNAASSLYYLGKSLTTKHSWKKEKYANRAKNHAIATVAGLAAVGCTVAVFLLGSIKIGAPVGIGVSLATAGIAIYAGIKGKLPPLPGFLKKNRGLLAFKQSIENKLKKRSELVSSLIKRKDSRPQTFVLPEDNPPPLSPDNSLTVNEAPTGPLMKKRKETISESLVGGGSEETTSESLVGEESVETNSEYQPSHPHPFSTALMETVLNTNATTNTHTNIPVDTVAQTQASPAPQVKEEKPINEPGPVAVLPAKSESQITSPSMPISSEQGENAQTREKRASNSSVPTTNQNNKQAELTQKEEGPLGQPSKETPKISSEKETPEIPSKKETPEIESPKFPH